MLGEVVFSDVSYAGETGESRFSMQFWRNKANEFQVMLNQVDTAAQAAVDAIEADIDPELSNQLLAMLDEFDAKKTVFRLTAEGINAGAAVINAAGGRFPQLSIPSGLGFVPLAIPAATIAAFAVAASLLVWGAQFVSGVNERMAYAQMTGTLSPEKQAQLAEIKVRAQAAQTASSQSPLVSISNAVKWGAIALLGWMAFQAFQRTQRAD